MRQRVSTFPLPTATRRILPPTRGRVFLRAAVRGITVRERKVELRFCNQRTLVPFPSLRRDAGRLACASTRTIAVPSTGTAAGGTSQPQPAGIRVHRDVQLAACGGGLYVTATCGSTGGARAVARSISVVRTVSLRQRPAPPRVEEGCDRHMGRSRA